MGAKANLVNEHVAFGAGMDSVVIRHYVAGIIGGRTLDMTGFAESVIKAGHVVIQSTTDETIFKPMPVANGAYATLPTGYKYAGVVVCSKPATEPMVGIMYSGEVNDVASPYPVDTIKAAMKAELPTLVFMHD